MIFQISANIFAKTTLANGKIDAILLTGGVAHSKYITNEIIKRVK